MPYKLYQVAHDYMTSLVFRHSFSESQTNKMSEKEAIRPLPHLKTRESCRVSFLPNGRGPSRSNVQQGAIRCTRSNLTQKIQSRQWLSRKRDKDMQDKARLWCDICVPPSANPSTRMRNGVLSLFLPRMKRNIHDSTISTIAV